MRSFTSIRVVKSNAVEVNEPRLLECPPPRLFEVNRQQKPVTGERHAPADEAPQPGSEISDETGAGEAQETASQIIARAQAEAAEIRRNAEAEVEKLKGEIRWQAEEKIFPAAQKKGFNEGYQAGAAEGEKYRTELEEKLADAKTQWALAQRAAQEEFAKVDKDLVHLAVQIAGRVIRAEVQADPGTILERIRTLTLLPQERKGWTLHLSPEDVRWIERLKPEERPVDDWIADERLTEGDCYLECREGLFDARLAAQLEKLEQCLQEDLKHDRVEQSGSAG